MMFSALVIEDDSEIRNWLVELVRDAFPRASTEAVPTIEQAYEAVKGKSYSIALVDINLPDGCGIDFVREIMQQSPDTYCVMATIYDDDKNLFASLRAGARGYLLKTQPRNRLLKQLQGIMQDEPPLSPAVARRMMQFFQREMEEKKAGKLTERELEVLSLAARGLRRKEIATSMDISANTVAGYLKDIYRKLKISTQAEAAIKAMHLGLLDDIK